MRGETRREERDEEGHNHLHRRGLHLTRQVGVELLEPLALPLRRALLRHRARLDRQLLR